LILLKKGLNIFASLFKTSLSYRHFFGRVANLQTADILAKRYDVCIGACID